MNFDSYWLYFSPTRHAYIFDAPDDYIGSLMKRSPVASIKTPKMDFMIARQTLVLLYVLHILEVRP